MTDRSERAPEPAAPAGVVALVFTDVQGSTALWERAPEPMREALRVHDAALRRLLRVHQGYEVKTEGDAFLCAFSRSLDAVRFCLDAQEALHDAPWPAALLQHDEAAEVGGFRGLRVRMGAHVGAPERRPDPITGRMDYFGPVVNRAARVSSAAHGGQVLISGAVWDEARDHVRCASRSLGQHRLKGLEQAESLWQILPQALVGRRFPPVRTLDAHKTNLAAQPGDFVGRAADLAALEERFARDARLVTVVGPPGCGKSRLCRFHAAVHLDAYNRDGGVWFVDLADARSAGDIAESVALALEITVRTGLPDAQVVAMVGDALAGRGPILLLMDPFEGLVDQARATLGAWLRQAPKARFLVASRERLRVEGEACIELAPLAEADASAPAAAAGLDEGARASIRRSWDRLAPWEAGALARCTVFRDGFTLDAAERVVDLSPWSEAPWILDVLQALGDKSLVHTRLPTDAHGEVRFGLYAPIAAFAAEQLEGEARSAAEAGHRAWAIDAARDLSPRARAGDPEARRSLGVEAGNLRVAAERALAAGEAEEAAELALAIVPVAGASEGLLVLIDTIAAASPKEPWRSRLALIGPSA